MCVQTVGYLVVGLPVDVVGDRYYLDTREFWKSQCTNRGRVAKADTQALSHFRIV